MYKENKELQKNISDGKGTNLGPSHIYSPFLTNHCKL